MSKRLILILALAFAVGITSAAYAEVQNIKVSGDLTFLGISRMLDLRGENDDGDGRSDRALATIARIRIDADLTDNVMATVRLLNERYWGTETENATDVSATNEVDTNSSIDIDLAFVTIKEFLYSPLTLTVGRQELHFGSDMIVGDPDTNNAATTASPFGANAGADDDLSARKSFDAIRATLDYDPLVIDLVLAKVRERTLASTDDEDLYGVNLNYRLGDKRDTVVELYYFEKNTGRQNDANEASDRIQTIGSRVATELVENLNVGAEIAYQFGDYTSDDADLPTADRKAWAAQTFATLNLPDAKFSPVLTVIYSYFSGDHENNAYTTESGTYRGWDPMYENQTSGHIANALFAQTNVHLLGGITQIKPFEDVSLKGEYYAYWWANAYPDGASITNTAHDADVNLAVTERRFAGQEVDLTLTYDYTEDVQLGLMGGLFLPGPSFDKDNDSICSEIIGSMKVTF